MAIGHALHKASGYALRHPVYSTAEVLLVVVLTALAVTIFAETPAMSSTARASSGKALEQAQPQPSWVWKKRSSPDNDLFAFGAD